MKTNINKILVMLLIVVTSSNTKLLAQNKFESVIKVNENVISKYELSQRITLLQVLRVEGVLNKIAIDGLIDERLLKEFADQSKISVPQERIDTELIALATKFNLSKDEFLSELNKLGVSKLTVEEFLKNRHLLNEVVYYKFSNRANISDDEIDAYIMNGSASIELKLAEIILPFNYNSINEAHNLANTLKDRLLEGVSFESIAKDFSKSPTAKNGGLIGWVPINQIPEDLGNKLLTSQVNAIIGPEVFDNMIILYKLFKTREVPLFKNVSVILDYIEMEHTSENNLSLENTLLLFEDNNNCLNLKFELKKYESLEHNFNRLKAKIEEIPISKYNYLNKLDAGEISVIKDNKKFKNPILIMLCSRQQTISENDRELARQYLISKRLSFLADGFLADLRSDAKIIFK